MELKEKISMEYEARVMIDEQQYEKIKEDYINKYFYHSIINENYYYDLSPLYLIHNHMVLRKRICGDKQEFTLKIKGEKGDIEITNEVNTTSLDINDLISDGIKSELDKNNIDYKKLKNIAYLKTERVEIPFDEYLFVIDKNYFNDKIDFNLEVESNSRKLAKKYLSVINKKYGINDDKKYYSKSKRAILKL